MIILPNSSIITMAVVRPTGNERYRYTKMKVDVLDNFGKVKISGIVPFEILDLIHLQMEELYDNGTSMKIDFPITNTLYRYSIYGGLVNSEIYHIFIVRDIINGGEEYILDLKLYGFDVAQIIYELGTELNSVMDEGCDIYPE